MKKLKVFALALIFLPCLCFFAACNDDGKEIIGIDFDYNGEKYFSYEDTGTIEVEYGQKISLIPENFDVTIKFKNGEKSKMKGNEAVSKYNVKFEHNIPTDNITPQNTYTLFFSVNNDIKKDIKVDIKKRAIRIPYAQNFVYDGDEHVPEFIYNDGDQAFLKKLTNIQPQVNAGKYEVEWKLLDTNNTYWYTQVGDAAYSNKIATWEIEPKKYIKPVAKEMIFNNTEQKVALFDYDANVVNLSGDVAKTNAGKYTVNFSLKDKKNTAWQDGKSDDFSINWEILPKKIEKPTVSSQKLYYDGLEKSPILNNFDDTIMGISNNNQILPNKTYTSTVTLTNKNYAWLDGKLDDISLEWTIEKGFYPMPDDTSNLLIATYGDKLSSLDFSNIKLEHPGTWSLKSNKNEDALVGDAGFGYVLVSYLNETGYYQEYNGQIKIKINKKGVNKPEIKAGSPTKFDYDKKPHKIIIDGIDNTLMGVENTEQTNAGFYNAYIYLKDTKNYEWNGTCSSDYLNFEWSIAPRVIQVTNDDTKVYEIDDIKNFNINNILNDKAFSINVVDGDIESELFNFKIIDTQGNDMDGYTIKLRIGITVFDEILEKGPNEDGSYYFPEGKYSNYDYSEEPTIEEAEAGIVLTYKVVIKK